MGKWSPAYYDDLLHMKYRCLTYNAVDKLRKLKVEDDLVELNPELRITHEQFIQDLDVTDTFTQRLIEILVQEVAARRHSSRTNRGNARGAAACSARTANALLVLSESCRGTAPRPSRRSEFLFGSRVWDGDSDGAEEVGMDEYTPEPEPLLFGDQPSLTLGSRIGGSLRDAASSSSSQWRALDLIFSPPNRPSEIHSPPAPTTRPSLLPLMSARSGVARQSSLIRRPASASSVTYFRPRHRATDFEAQTQRLRDRARVRELLDYPRGPSGGENNAAVGRSQAPPESFARRESGPGSDDESDLRPMSLSPALPPAPVPAHAHPHSHSSGPSHSTLRRVTSELSVLDRTIEANRREQLVARQDFAARFRRGVSSLAPIPHRSPSPIAIAGSSSGTSAGVAHPQPRESLRAALWGAGPRDEDGLPTPRSLTPESGERGSAA